MSAVANLLRIPQYARNVQRMRFVIRVLFTHGFGHVLDRAGVGRLARFGRNRIFGINPDLANRAWEVRVRLAMESLGPTFVKLGQMLATRPDLVPMSLIHELRKLQDDVPPIPFAAVRRVVQDELGEPLLKLYRTFDEQPLAAASIGQVHRAVLPDGTEVVVKVQRPGLDDTIRTDLDLLMFLAQQVEDSVPDIRQFHPVAAVEQFARGLKLETDFSNELRNIERFRKQFSDTPQLHLPTTYSQISGRRVLTMEFIDGAKVTDSETVQAWGLSGAEIAKTGTAIVIASIFEHGFFHADPHPGNFFVLRDGRIALIDFGMMGSLDRERIDDLLTFLASLLLNDTEMLVSQLMDLGLLDDSVDVRALRGELHELMARYYGVDLAGIDIGTFITEVFESIVRFDVQMPADLLLIGKAISTMEGIAREIHPDFNPLVDIRPQLIRLYVRRALDPSVYSRRVVRLMHDYWGLLSTFPGEARGLIRRAKAGELQVQVLDAGEPVRHNIAERRVNRGIVATCTLFFWAAFTYLLPSAVEAGFWSVTGIWTLLLALNGTWVGSLLAFSMLRSREL
jgi:ubiquinone biosynthesis protein